MKNIKQVIKLLKEDLIDSRKGEQDSCGAENYDDARIYQGRAEGLEYAIYLLTKKNKEKK